jgi:hypothetical protein
MLYKVVNSDNLIIDVLDSLNYVMFQEANKLLLSCDERKAQGILSSDQTVVWHVDSFDEFPPTAPIYNTVNISEIDEDTYNELKQSLEMGEQPTEPPKENSSDDDESGDTSKPLTLGNVWNKVQENTTELNTILGKYDVGSVDLQTLQYYRQEENKVTLKQFLQNNPILWQDGNYYGVTQDDQNEMIADKTAYEFKQSVGQTDWKLEWHNTKHACREFTVDEFAALLNAIIDFVYPFRKLQEEYKEQIYACESKEQVVELELDYSEQALKKYGIKE